MTFQHYLRILRKQWSVLLIAVTLGLSTAGLIYLIRPPEYTSRLTLNVVSQFGGSAESAYSGTLLSQQRAKSYAALLTSTRVSSEIANKLGIAISPEELATHLQASVTTDSTLIDVQATASNPEEATAIANTAATVVTDLLDEMERMPSPERTPLSIRTVQAATVPAAASSLGILTTLGLGLLAGLTVGVGGALVREALDSSTRAQKDLQRTTGAPALGVTMNGANAPTAPGDNSAAVRMGPHDDGGKRR